MAAEDCMQTIGVGADYGGHDWAYSPEGQTWNFPLIYEAESTEGLMANISIDGVVTPLSLGEQQITGTGQVVTVEWQLAQPGAGITLFANPWNEPNVSWPIGDNVPSGSQYYFQLNQAASPINWFLEITVMFQNNGSAQQLYVAADGNNVGNLPTGYSTYTPNGSAIAIICNGLVGDLFMQYNLTGQ